MSVRRRLVNALLAAWMLAAGVGVSVEHAHAGGDRSHSHGLGLSPVGLPAPSDHTVRHTHLVLLGIEVAEVPFDPTPGGDDQESSTEPVMGSAAPDPADDFAPPLAAAPPSVELPIIPQPVSFVTAAPTAPPPHVCPVASRRVSGVSRS